MEANSHTAVVCYAIYLSSFQLTSVVSEALPCLSSAVSTIIATSENEEFKAKCYKLLKASISGIYYRSTLYASCTNRD